MMKYSNIALLLADSYKISHKGFSPEGLTEIYSNGTPRFSHYFKQRYPEFDGKYVVFGTQYAAIKLKELFDEFFKTPKEDIISDIVKILGPYIGTTELKHFEDLHDLQYLPIEFKALEEGSLVNVGTPYFTVRNTHGDFQWITNYLETIMSVLMWKPLLTATVSRQFNKLSNMYSDFTCDNKDHVPFQNHDFSMRGQDGIDADTAVAMAWLTHSYGTDNVPGVAGVYDYYNGDKCNLVAGSIPAGEHSVTSANIIMNNPTDLREGEKQFLVDVLTKYYPTGLVASVFDTYDYWEALSGILPEIKDIIMSREGKLVVRPDSGDPVDVVCGTVSPVAYESIEEAKTEVRDDIWEQVKELLENGDWFEKTSVIIFNKEDGKHYQLDVNVEIGTERGGISDNDYKTLESVSIANVYEVNLTPEQKGSIQVLWEIFGGTVNSKGYKVLDPHIGLIYGDGINFDRANEIFNRLARKGFAASNVVYGIGSYSLHLSSRDDLGFAIKATHAVIDGKNVPIFKAPKTDSSKKSAKGYLKIVKDGTDFKLIDDVSFEEEQSSDNELKVIFKDGNLNELKSLDQIREKLGTKSF